MLRTAAWKPTFKSVLRPTNGFQVVRNTRHATDARLVTQSKTEIRNACTQQRMQSVLFSACIAFFSCTCVAVFYLCGMSSVRCVHCERHLKSVFIGLRAVSKFSYTTHATQRTPHNGRTACDAIKNRNTQRMHTKNTTHAINFILCVAFFVCIHCVHWIRCVAYDSLETDL